MGVKSYTTMVNDDYDDDDDTNTVIFFFFFLEVGYITVKESICGPHRTAHGEYTLHLPRTFMLSFPTSIPPILKSYPRYSRHQKSSLPPAEVLNRVVSQQTTYYHGSESLT